MAHLDSKSAAALGLSADWGIVWEAFLRLFDKGDHDIAGSSEEIEGLIEARPSLAVRANAYLGSLKGLRAKHSVMP